MHTKLQVQLIIIVMFTTSLSGFGLHIGLQDMGIFPRWSNGEFPVTS